MAEDLSFAVLGDVVSNLKVAEGTCTCAQAEGKGRAGVKGGYHEQFNTDGGGRSCSNSTIPPPKHYNVKRASKLHVTHKVMQYSSFYVFSVFVFVCLF